MIESTKPSSKVIPTICFCLAYALYETGISSMNLHNSNPAVTVFIKFFVTAGAFYTLYVLLVYFYEKWIWKYIHKDIEINGTWEYAIIRREPKLTPKSKPKIIIRKGYVRVQQDCYTLSMVGYNIGSGDNSEGVAIWESSSCFLKKNNILDYDYDLFGERNGQRSRRVMGRARVSLIGKPVKTMNGNWYDVPTDSEAATRVGEIFFKRSSEVKLNILFENYLDSL